MKRMHRNWYRGPNGEKFYQIHDNSWSIGACNFTSRRKAEKAMKEAIKLTQNYFSKIKNDK